MKYNKINLALMFLLNFGVVKLQSSQEGVADVPSKKRSRADMERRVVFSEFGNRKILPSIGSSPQDLMKSEEVPVFLKFESLTDRWKSVSNLGNCKKLSPENTTIIDLSSKRFLKINTALDNQTRSIYGQDDASEQLLRAQLAILLEFKNNICRKLDNLSEVQRQKLGEQPGARTAILASFKKSLEHHRMSELNYDINTIKKELEKFKN